MLSAHHIDARSSQRSKGEIDVCFRINDKRFILEAKWEQGRINIDPIAKLGLRINQRIPNNLGIILSMSGYTRDALQQMNEAGRPHVLLIEREVFEAMLYGTVEADLLFEACVDVASFEGIYHITLSEVLKYIPGKHRQFTIDESINTPVDDSLLQRLHPQGNVSVFEVVKADLPFGQSGISIAGSTVYVTLTDGIYVIDGGRFVRQYAIDNPQNRCIHSVPQGKTFFIRNGSAMAVDQSGNPSIISKKYPGHVRLFRWNDEINLISNGDDFASPVKPVRLIRDITGKAAEIVCNYPVSCCVDSCIIGDNRYAVIGSAGLRFYEEHRQQWHLDVLNGASVTFFEGHIFFLENGVRLRSIDVNGGNLKTLAAFNLDGSVGDFDLLNAREFYFHLCYQEESMTKTCVTYLKTG